MMSKTPEQQHSVTQNVPQPHDLGIDAFKFGLWKGYAARTVAAAVPALTSAEVVQGGEWSEGGGPTDSPASPLPPPRGWIE